MKNRIYLDYVRDIIDSIRDIESFIKDMEFEEFKPEIRRILRDLKK